LTANSLVARKSADAGTARSYKIFADDRTFYMLIPSDTATIYQGWAFGDFYSIMATPDSYRTFIVGKIVENTTTATGDRLDVIATTAVAVTGHFIPRAYTGLGTSVANGLSGDVLKSGAAVTLAGLWPYPNAADGGAYMSQLWVVEPTGPVLRGRMRGFWEWCHPIASITDGDTLGGTGTLTGRTFEFVKQSGNAGVYLIETSNTLETN
jgi:hypothetical protein